ncbi:MAG: DNA translocase FtsK [Gemmatimonadota bacterium]|nr:DNA translocase FtsK [Gemmatimonadota bacterium]
MSHLKRELTGVALILLSIFLALAMISGWSTPGSSSCAQASNLMGPIGSCIRGTVVYVLGRPAALLIPLAIAIHALRLFGWLEQRTDRNWMVFLFGIAVLLPTAIGLTIATWSERNPSTGIFGGFLSYYLDKGFGQGAWIVLFMAMSALMITTLAWNPVRMLIGRRAPRQSAPANATVPDESTEPSPEEFAAIDQSIADGGLLGDAGGVDGAISTDKKKREKRSKAALAEQRVEKISAEIDATDYMDLAGDELPSTTLLSPPPVRNVDLDKRELDQMGVKLKEALRTFKVEAEIIGRTTGPVVTQFEVEPAAGVKVRQIANLSNDLALAMRAQSIRIVAPIPGRGAVGVEVPNPTAEIVGFRELLESSDFKQARAALPIALGKDLEGKPVIADLAKMPHLLIAGATGSGKSVCINTIITSLIYRHTPRTLRLLLVDPKMVELSVYNVLPHLRHKVITDNRDAAAVLKWAVHEMQDRYELLAANGCRNIQDFNRRVQTGGPLKMPRRPDVGFEELAYTRGVLPYIVVVIDELADLMMTVQGEVETPLAMLAQKARAIGLHLILATQRPSVNVITGLIKANFPSRIAFRVASQIDSRTILDGMGAESLLGNGDMLFVPPGKSEPSRLQGAFIPSEDTEKLAAWYGERREAKRRAAEEKGLLDEESFRTEADILEEVRALEAAASGGSPADAGEPGDRDKLFREAAEVVIQNQLGSTSLLQRRLKVGYGRAARIIDQLHDAGVLGPPDGSKPRDVLCGLEDLDRICGSSR